MILSNRRIIRRLLFLLVSCKKYLRQDRVNRQENLKK